MPDPPVIELVREAVPVLALAALLVSAYRHPRPRTEAAVALGATAAALSVGELPAGAVGSTLADLAPVVAFLATVLLVADLSARAGLFAAAGRLLRTRTRTRGQARPDGVRLFTLAFLLAAAVTVVLSLDATVVLLTPVVVAAAAAQGRSARPGAFACVRMANSASLLLPVSNLTNLLALPALGLTFAGFAAEMALPLLAVLAVEYAALRVLLRRELAPRRGIAGPAAAAPPAEEQPGSPVVPAVVVTAMLAGFVVTSPLGLEPWVTSTVAAVVLTAWAARRRLVGPAGVVAALNPSFVLFVLALGVVVAAIAQGFLGELVGSAVAHLVPVAADGTATSFAALLVVALLATVLANLVTNLSATLLLVPLLVPLGPTAVLAALVGLNVGSGLTLSGSLANLLWRRGLSAPGVRPDERPTLAEFHRVSLVVTPLSILAAVAALALVA